jgi:hypothetical protein
VNESPLEEAGDAARSTTSKSANPPNWPRKCTIGGLVIAIGPWFLWFLVDLLIQMAGGNNLERQGVGWAFVLPVLVLTVTGGTVSLIAGLVWIVSSGKQ